MTKTQALPREALTLFNALLGHLQEETKLAELLEGERDVLHSLRAPGLSDLNREKERVLALIDRVAGARGDSLEELTQQLGIGGTGRTISGILDRLPPLEQRCLRDARDRLLHVAQMVKRRGEISARLLSVSLDAIYGVLQLVQREATLDQQVYGDEGALASCGTGVVLRHTA